MQADKAGKRPFKCIIKKTKIYYFQKTMKRQLKGNA